MHMKLFTEWIIMFKHTGTFAILLILMVIAKIPCVSYCNYRRIVFVNIFLHSSICYSLSHKH